MEQPLPQQPVDWWKEVGEWAHDHAVYTKDRPDTVEVAALQAFLDELGSRRGATVEGAGRHGASTALEVDDV